MTAATCAEELAAAAVPGWLAEPHPASPAPSKVAAMTRYAVRQAMRWAADERRLAEACGAVLAFMHRHAVATKWGCSDLN